MLYVPTGFAHGFCVVSDVADVIYLVSTYYDATLERAVAWDDPDLAIPWPATEPILSERDRHNRRLTDAINGPGLRPPQAETNKALPYRQPSRGR